MPFTYDPKLKTIGEERSYTDILKALSEIETSIVNLEVNTKRVFRNTINLNNRVKALEQLNPPEYTPRSVDPVNSSQLHFAYQLQAQAESNPPVIGGGSKNKYNRKTKKTNKNKKNKKNNKKKTHNRRK
jgi:hypothetical protein